MLIKPSNSVRAWTFFWRLIAYSTNRLKFLSQTMLLNNERISVITTSPTPVKESAAPHLVLRGDLILPLNPRIKGVVRLSLSPPRPPFPSRPPLIIISCAYFWCLRLKSCCELNIFIITSLSFTDQLTKYPRCQGNLACFVYVVNSRVNANNSLFQITRFSPTYLTNYLTIRVKFLIYLSWNLHSITV